MRLIDRINQTEQLTALCEAGDFAGAAAAWPEVRLPDVQASGRMTLAALEAADIDADAVLLVVEQIPRGRRLLGLLDAEGVNWVDPLTVQMLEGMVAAGGITQQTADTLIAISKRVEASPTADAIQRVWICEQAVAAKRAERNALMTWVANAEAELSADKIAGLTIEQLQARCDAVAASADGLVGES